MRGGMTSSISNYLEAGMIQKYEDWKGKHLRREEVLREDLKTVFTKHRKSLF